jgi:hypothetical protein
MGSVKSKFVYYVGKINEELKDLKKENGQLK